MGDWTEWLTVTDWISPLLGFAQDAANGPSHTFMIPVGCGRSGGDITKLLRRRGVKTWGHMIVNGQIMFTVKKRQMEFARHILRSNGL